MLGACSTPFVEDTQKNTVIQVTEECEWSRIDTVTITVKDTYIELTILGKVSIGNLLINR